MGCVLYIVRHTSTVVEPDICYGQSDVALSPDFPAAAAAVAAKLQQTDFTRIYSSPLLRCRTLASFLGGDKTVVEDDRLMELNFGKWEGLSWQSIYDSPKGKQWFADYLNESCEGGESFLELEARVSDFIDSLGEEQGNILIITHAGVIRAAARLFGAADVDGCFALQLPFGCVARVGENGEFDIL